jgi:phosphoglycolate phosphatase-like HAD superfamily hydrolase
MKAVLFDLDGVITSERIYWNCSGLALAKFLGRKLPEKEAEKIKLAKSLLPDDVIRGFKENGVNSNWDIAYASSILVRAGKDVKDFLAELKRRNMKGVEYLKLLDEFDPSEKHDRDGGSWGEAHKRFQACYYELEDTDEPAIPLEKIKKSLDELKAMGLRLGIVSGRPLKEADKPLKKWEL